MRFCCYVLQNLGVIGIVMTFLGNKFSFKLDLCFMEYMHAKHQKQNLEHLKIFIFDFYFQLIFFDFLIEFLTILCLDWDQKPLLFYKKKLQSLN